jgi:hypothetical protein
MSVSKEGFVANFNSDILIGKSPVTDRQQWANAM